MLKAGFKVKDESKGRDKNRLTEAKREPELDHCSKA